MHAVRHGLSSLRNSLFRSINAHVEVDGLCLGIVLQDSLTTLSAETTLLISTEGNAPVDKVVKVNPGSTSLESIRNAESALVVVGVNTSCEAIGSIIGESNDFLLALELADCDDRTKDFLLDNLHVGFDVGENRRLDIVSAVFGGCVGCAAEMGRGSFSFTGFNVSENLVVLHTAVLGSLVDVGVKVVADLDLGHAFRVGGDKLVVDVFVDVDARAGVACLAVVHVDAPCGPFNRLGNVGVGEDDVLHS